jgi:hypothetical protein
MRLGPHRPFFSDLVIEQQLLGVVVLPEAAERRPHQIVIVGRLPKIPVEDEPAILFADPKLVVVRVKDFDAVLGAFGKRRAVPSVFLRAVGPRLGLAGPAGHFELGSPWRQFGIRQPEFDVLHRAVRSMGEPANSQELQNCTLAVTSQLRLEKSLRRKEFQL